MCYNISMLSAYRSQLMGIATIMIIICHAHAMINNLPHFVYRMLDYGNLGVDIFLLLSGVGCYYSLYKNRDLKRFYKRRIVRLLIPYLIITFPFALYYVIAGRDTLCDFCLTMTTLGFWIHHNTAWFVSLMIPLYVFAPALFTVTKRGG